MQEIKQQEQKKKAILVGVDLGDYNMDSAMEELSELAHSCDLEVAGIATQKREVLDSATCIGEGRLREIADLAQTLEVDLLVFDCELTGAMLRNIEQATHLSVIDRTMLILDIFAQRAKSAEGRLQVELAQQKYRLPRLIGLGNALSRLGGGVGTRGPGETKLETDRRHIQRRILSLERELEQLQAHRKLIRDRRKKEGRQVIALVGYTNAGKSTLLNALTQANVLSQDMLFATLDPTTRALILPDEREVLLTDTVGFLRRLPHHLIQAFYSTLEEALAADLLLLVCDRSDPEYEEQLALTRQILRDLGGEDIPSLTVYNKWDRVPFGSICPKDAVCISAKTGEGLSELLRAITKALPPTRARINICLPYDQAGLLSRLRENGKVFSETYEEDGIHVEALCEQKILHIFSAYLV